MFEPHRRLAALALVGVLLAGCASSATVTPASSPSPASSAGGSPSAGPSTSSSPLTTGPASSADNDALFSSIEQQVQQIRQLSQKTPVARKILDEAQLSALITSEFDKDNPPAQVAANELLLKSFGLLPAGASLKDLDVQLLSSQVAGLYDPATKTMDVVSKNGQFGPIEQITYAHEFDHALQDQNFGLAKLGLDDTSNSDRALARLSLPEGDATLLMTQWAETHLTSVASWSSWTVVRWVSAHWVIRRVASPSGSDRRARARSELLVSSSPSLANPKFWSWRAWSNSWA